EPESNGKEWPDRLALGPSSQWSLTPVLSFNRRGAWHDPENSIHPPINRCPPTRHPRRCFVAGPRSPPARPCRRGRKPWASRQGGELLGDSVVQPGRRPGAVEGIRRV